MRATREHQRHPGRRTAGFAEKQEGGLCERVRIRSWHLRARAGEQDEQRSDCLNETSHTCVCALSVMPASIRRDGVKEGDPAWLRARVKGGRTGRPTIVVDHYLTYTSSEYPRPESRARVIFPGGSPLKPDGIDHPETRRCACPSRQSSSICGRRLRRFCTWSVFPRWSGRLECREADFDRLLTRRSAQTPIQWAQLAYDVFGGPSFPGGTTRTKRLRARDHNCRVAPGVAWGRAGPHSRPLRGAWFPLRRPPRGT